MAGYTRADVTNNIADGNVINASDLDAEYDAIAAAFDAATGHTHDGTAANGAPITKIGPAQDLVVSTGAITPKTDNTVDLGSATFEFKDGYFDGKVYTDAINLDGTDITATAAELNLLDGVTASTAELNLLDGVTATTAELNYVDGVTSAIQTQLDGKQPLDAQLTDIAGLTPTDNGVIIGNGTNFVLESGDTLRTSLGLAIGTNVQAYDADTAKTDVAQTFTASQRGTVTTDNDGSLDLSVTNNFQITPSGSLTLTFTNMTAGQSGFILLINTGGYTISAHANTKVQTGALATISAAGTYILSYFTNGTVTYVTHSGAMA